MFDIKEEIEKNKDEMLERLIGLLEIPSVLDNETITEDKPFGNNIKNALDYMLNMAKKDGFDVLNIDNYAGCIDYGSGKEMVGILCHLDVVPANNDGWIYPPFSPTIEECKLYARGAVDDKGPTMAAYYALKMIKDNNIKLNKKIRIILGLDEETEMRGIKHYLKKEKMPDLAFAPDANFPLINGEKGHFAFFINGKLSNSHIIHFHSGERMNMVPDRAEVLLDINLKNEFLQYLEEKKLKGEIIDNKLVIYGKGAHAMCPNLGINAIFLMINFLKKHIKDDEFINFMDEYIIDDFNGNKLKINAYHEEMKELTMNIGILDVDKNVFKFSVDIRFPMDECIEIIKNAFSTVCKKYNYIPDFKHVDKVHYINCDDILVKTLLKSYRKVTNDYSLPITIGGGTYSKMLDKCVAFGPVMPNKEELAHQANEYIELKDLINSSIIYTDALINLGK